MECGKKEEPGLGGGGNIRKRRREAAVGIKKNGWNRDLEFD